MNLGDLGAVEWLRLFGKSPSLREEIMEESKHHMLAGGFKYFFMFIPVWGKDPI